MGGGRKGKRTLPPDSPSSSTTTIITTNTPTQAPGTATTQQISNTSVQDPSHQISTSTPGPSHKRQKREAYASSAQNNPSISLPRKKFYRQRAHANPFSDHSLIYPVSPTSMDWTPHFPSFVDSAGSLVGGRTIEVADIGCGFGGLLFALASVMPESLILGMEIRTAVTEFVERKIGALREIVRREGWEVAARLLDREAGEDKSDYEEDEQNTQQNKKGKKGKKQKIHPVQSTEQQTEREEEQNTQPTKDTKTENNLENPNPQPGTEPLKIDSNNPTYETLSVIRSNAMKFTPNFFPKASLKQIYLCFPDPHFKARKHKARIVSPTLLSEYAYVLRPGGLVYTITDVEDLADWMAKHLDGHASFEKVDEDKLEGLERMCAKVMRDETEEGKKVTRNKGSKFVGIWRRLEDPAWPVVDDSL